MNDVLILQLPIVRKSFIRFFSVDPPGGWGEKGCWAGWAAFLLACLNLGCPLICFASWAFV